jgi:predicted nucleic acid-binding protein
MRCGGAPRPPRTSEQRGQHRAPPIPDLLIAAVAELNQRTVLHLDEEFDLIADLTGPPMERLPVD